VIGGHGEPWRSLHGGCESPGAKRDTTGKGPLKALRKHFGRGFGPGTVAAPRADRIESSARASGSQPRRFPRHELRRYGRDRTCCAWRSPTSRSPTTPGCSPRTASAHARIIVRIDEPIVLYSAPLFGVTELTPDREELYRKLLEFNDNLLHCAYALDNEQIVLSGAQQIEDLDYGEFQAMIEDMVMAIDSHLDQLTKWRPATIQDQEGT
jgi:hypothetical protein